MIVYVVLSGLDYEGESLVGVTQDPESAKEMAENDLKRYHPTHEVLPWESHPKSRTKAQVLRHGRNFGSCLDHYVVHEIEIGQPYDCLFDFTV